MSQADTVHALRRARQAVSFHAVVLALAGSAWAQRTARVSVDSSGMQANNGSSLADAAVSGNGRFVAFTSPGSNLVTGDANGVGDVFLRDLQTGVTECVSLTSTGTFPVGESTGAALSADGRFVAFESASPDIVVPDANNARDVFVRDRLLGTLERVSVATNGSQGDSGSWLGALSADGRFVVFSSDATNLAASDTNAHTDVYFRDRLLGTTERVSLGVGGAQADAHCYVTSLSADGRFVGLASEASNLVAGDTNMVMDAFLHDRLLGFTERVSLTTSGAQGNHDSTVPFVSDDGRYVAFTSAADNLYVGDTNGHYDAFVRDRQTGTTERVNPGLGGAPANAISLATGISADGRFVLLSSLASNLVLGDTNIATDALVRDRQSATIERVSVDSSGAQANSSSMGLALSADASFVVFVSSASNLVAGDTNGVNDIFLRDRRVPIRLFCAGDGIDTAHTSTCPCANVGAPGNGCASSVNPAGARLDSTGTTYADDVRLVATGMPSTSICIYLQGDALDDAVFGDGVRCAGGVLLRLRAVLNAGGASSFPDSTETITLSARGGVAPGSGARLHYQTYYRNAAAAFCPPATFNVTNGVLVNW